MRRILLISAAIIIATVLLEAISSAQCRPGYTGSGYYRSSSCAEYLIPRGYSSGVELISPFVGTPILPGPFGYGYASPYVVIPPRHYFRPWYFEPPSPYVGDSSSYTVPPSGIPPRSGYGYSRGLRLPIEPRSRIVLGSDGVWTND
jgi:hypothetical protein